MADIMMSVLSGVNKRLKDMGDGTVAEVVYTANGSSGGGGSALADTLLTDANGVLFVARDNGTAISYARVDTGVNYTPIAPIGIVNALANGTDNSGVSQPSGGTGIRGWLSGIYGGLASLVATANGKASRVVLVDPLSGNGSLVQAFHNADNQSLGATSYGLMTGGVDQLLNGAGTLDRKRGVSGDGMAATGLSADVPMLWNGTGYDRAPGSAASGLKVAVSNAVTVGAGANAIGDVGVQYRPSAAGAASVIAVMSPATPVVTAAKASAGRLLGVMLQNSATSLRSVKFWNALTTGVTLSTTAALFEIDIPAGGSVFMGFEGGIGFSNALAYAVTGAKGLSDATATGLVANDVSGSLIYA